MKTDERDLQNRVIELLQNMGFQYLGNLKETCNSNIKKELLEKFLKKPCYAYSQELINKAMYQLENTSRLSQGIDIDEKLYNSNKECYKLLRYGQSYKIEVNDISERVHFIDWNNIKNNDFYVAEEVTVIEKQNKRPDLVLYVNGIALGVLELKKGSVFVSEGIRQNIANQREFIPQFFTTVQLIMAGNESQGIRYGTALTPEKFYLLWKGYDFVKKEKFPMSFLEELEYLLEPQRFLDIIHNFIIYDKGIKKICRYNQYYGVKAAQSSIAANEGGIIWHTQGSGKSLTMVFLAQWILENLADYRVLVITDREELDTQIMRVFLKAEHHIYQTKSCDNLLKVLRKYEERLICSLIHKFGRTVYNEEDEKESEKAYDNFIKELEEKARTGFNVKGKFVIFVDECHRTQSGKLHSAMKAILPDALLIGFTGTPLLKKDKKTSIEVFGPYIHTYKYDEGVQDKIVLDLKYEARNVEQFMGNKEKLDQHFESKTKGLTEVAKAQLKKRWATLQEVVSSSGRIEKIVNDIIYDFDTKDILVTGAGNAILVVSSIYSACKYWEIFNQKGFKNCAVITSYSPNPKDIRTEDTGSSRESEALFKYHTYLKMVGVNPDSKNIAAAVKNFEENKKIEFIEEPAKMKLLIVVDKLLTGFDAPNAAYLYIDKFMQDHSLFQAVCRVNRVADTVKEYGYIVDYQDLFKSLEKSIKDYTGEAFENYDAEDVKGLLQDREESIIKDYYQVLEVVRSICENIPAPQSINEYKEFFGCSHELDSEFMQQKRAEFYKAVNRLIRKYAEVLEYIDIDESTQNEIKYYHEMKQAVAVASADTVDFKTFDADMRHLIDTYINAEDSEKITDFCDKTLLELLARKEDDIVEVLPACFKSSPEAAAEMIENHIRKVVNYEYAANPEYFRKISELLDNVVELLKQQRLEYKEFLKKVADIARQTFETNTANYPDTIRNSKQRIALFDNLGQNEALAVKLDEELRTNLQADYKTNPLKKKLAVNLIKNCLQTDDMEFVNRIYQVVENNYE